jgi:hypothetical protein
MPCKLNISEQEMQSIKESIKDFEPKFRTVLVQKRKHKKWRINKKWAKRYGFDEVEVLHPAYKIHVFQILEKTISDKFQPDFSNFVDIKDITFGR